jgi:hypothetical protein
MKLRIPILQRSLLSTRGRPRFLLGLTAVIKSRNRISRFRGFRCHSSLHVETPIPETPMAYRPCFFCRSDGCRVSASNLTAKTCPPIELLPMALDRCHASFQIDGCDYVRISPWLFPKVYFPRSFCLIRRPSFFQEI